LLLYRIGSYLHSKGIPILPKCCDISIRLIHNCAIFSETKIGRGTKFGYHGIGVVVHKRAIIGDNCSIGTGVTIGGRSQLSEVPVIGNNVYIAGGAKVLGDITVGDNCVIGANAVLLTSMPANTMAVGVPAKIIRHNINSTDYR
jgi:serine O-acetyltransferase